MSKLDELRVTVLEAVTAEPYSPVRTHAALHAMHDELAAEQAREHAAVEAAAEAARAAAPVDTTVRVAPDRRRHDRVVVAVEPGK